MDLISRRELAHRGTTPIRLDQLVDLGSSQPSLDLARGTWNCCFWCIPGESGIECVQVNGGGRRVGVTSAQLHNLRCFSDSGLRTALTQRIVSQ